VDDLDRYPRERTLVVVSGSQGEPMSALNRLVFGDTRKLGLEEDDVVLFSARIIPGSERRVGRVINEIYRRGAVAVTGRDAPIHVSGHPSQEDVKLMAAWTRPKYFIPVHGEMQQLLANRELALGMGWSVDRVLVPEVGRRIRFMDGEFLDWEEIPAGSVLIDGSSEEPMERRVLRDRRQLAADGVVVPVATVDRHHGGIVGEVQIMHRGYPLLDDEAMRRKTAQAAAQAAEALPEAEQRSAEAIQAAIRTAVKRMLRKRYRKTPLVLPVVLEV